MIWYGIILVILASLFGVLLAGKFRSLHIQLSAFMAGGFLIMAVRHFYHKNILLENPLNFLPVVAMVALPVFSISTFKKLGKANDHASWFWGFILLFLNGIHTLLGSAVISKQDTHTAILALVLFSIHELVHKASLAGMLVNVGLSWKMARIGAISTSFFALGAFLLNYLSIEIIEFIENVVMLGFGCIGIFFASRFWRKKLLCRNLPVEVWPFTMGFLIFALLH